MTVRINDELMRAGALCFTVRAASVPEAPPQGDDLFEPLRTAESEPAKAVLPQRDDLFEPSRGVEVRHAIRCRVWFQGRKNTRRFESIGAMYRWVVGTNNPGGHKRRTAELLNRQKRKGCPKIVRVEYDTIGERRCTQVPCRVSLKGKGQVTYPSIRAFWKNATGKEKLLSVTRFTKRVESINESRCPGYPSVEWVEIVQRGKWVRVFTKKEQSK